MKIDKYYRDAGKIYLNGSIASLFPAGLIIIGNFSIFHNRGLMFWTLPFLIYSLINFQFSLWRNQQSNGISKNLHRQSRRDDSIFQSEHLLVFKENTYRPCLLLFFSDGRLAGTITNFRDRGMGFFNTAKKFALYDFSGSLLGFYMVKGKQSLKIAAFDHNHKYIGCFARRKYTRQKAKKELLDEQGRFVGTVKGSLFFMDEHFVDSDNRELGRLRRGWMPLQWSGVFPEPNTPVLTLSPNLSQQDKVLQLSYLIYEYFLQR